jgi:hypothetical protein
VYRLPDAFLFRVVLNTFGRRIAGRSVATALARQVALVALTMALVARQ